MAGCWVPKVFVNCLEDCSSCKQLTKTFRSICPANWRMSTSCIACRVTFCYQYQRNIEPLQHQYSYSFYCYVLTVGKGDSAIFSEDLFRKRCEVLKKCVDGDPERQLQVIYGIQVVLAQKQHPKGVWFGTVVPTSRASGSACVLGLCDGHCLCPHLHCNTSKYSRK